MNQSANSDAKGNQILSWISTEFHPARLISSITASLVASLLIIILCISFAALIFSGELSAYIPAGIGIILTTAVITGLVIALSSSYPGTIGAPQDKVAPILALMVSTIAVHMPQGSTPEQTFLTALAAIAFASLLTGLFLGSLGIFRLGVFIRFIPFPVIGGFLAGSGWLMILGSIKTMTGKKVNLANLGLLVQPELFFKWFSGLVFALALLFVLRRFKHALTMPGMLLLAILVFYIFLRLSGTTILEARTNGWLLGNLPSGSLWKFLSVKAVTTANWKLVFANAGSIATILLVSTISLLLNASAIELQAEHEMDLDHELRAAGMANIAGGALGGSVGFHSLNVSALILKMGVRSRLVGIFVSLICLGVLLFGASGISFVPLPIIGGMLMYLGISFLKEWVYETWFKLPRSDYTVILLILFIIGGMGYLQGVAVGVIAAIILFVVKYSRINVVKHALNGTTFHSNVDRSKSHRNILKENGERILILRLHGFIFFGTANNLLNQVRSRANDLSLPSLQYVLLDFHEVSGIDTSAEMSLLKMTQLAKKKTLLLIFTHLSDEMRNQLEEGGILGENEKSTMSFPDLDYAVEWSENQILLAQNIEIECKECSLKEQLEELLPGTEGISRLMNFMERMEVPADFTLINQGEPPDNLYFIESGQINVLIHTKSGSTVRIRKMGGGTVVGEIGLYLSIRRTASVVTEKPSVVYRMSADQLKQMEAKDPQAAAAFHLYIARLLAERLSLTDKTLRAILD